MTIANLFARIGLKTDEHKAKSFRNAMVGVRNVMLTATAAAGAASAAITKVTSDALNAAAAFTHFETQTGASAQMLQKWQAVAEQTATSGESVAASIKAITDGQAKIRLGQGLPMGYQLLGIDPRQDPFKIMEQLREGTKNMSESLRKNVVSSLGVSSDMLRVLDLSADQFDSMANNGFIISPGAIKSLNATKSSLDLANRAIKWLKAQIAVGLAPQIKKLTTDMTKFIKVHKQAFIEGFKKAFTFVSKFVTAVSRAVSMIDRFVTSTIGWKNAIKTFLAVFAVMNVGALLSPIGLLVAGLGLLILVMEDLYVYSKGGKSLFGVLEQQFPKVTGVIKTVAEKIGEVFRLIGSFINGDQAGIDAILDSWGLFGDAIQKVIDGIEKLKEIMPKPDINATYKDATPGSQAKLAEKNAWPNAPRWFQEIMNFGLPTAPSAAGATTNNSNSRVTNVYIDTIEVADGDGLTDALNGMDAQAGGL